MDLQMVIIIIHTYNAFLLEEYTAHLKTQGGGQLLIKTYTKHEKLFPKLFFPSNPDEHTIKAQKWQFADETTLFAKSIRFRLKCTTFSQKFPEHSCLEEVFLKQCTQCLYPQKHNARCITDYINLSLEEQIQSLTNKATRNFLLHYL